MTQKYYYLPASELQLATDEEAKVYYEKAKAFVQSTNAYSSYLSVAMMAVAEYMAHQDDKTLRSFSNSKDQ